MRALLVLALLALGGCAAARTASKPARATSAPAQQSSESATRPDPSAGASALVEAPTATKATEADPCPSPDDVLDASVCAGLPSTHGLVPDQPLEWGTALNRAYFGRLVCDGGGWATVDRVSSVGPARVASKSPPGMPSFGVELLDLYRVTCPNDTLEVYSNMYRCGSRCPPAGLWVLPARRARAYEGSRAAAKAGQFDLALRLAQKHFPAEALTEREASWLGIVLMENNRIDEAVAAFTRAHEIDPADPYHLLHRGLAHRKRGDLDAYFGAVQEAIDAAGPKHALRGELLCRSRSHWERQGDAGRAEAVSREACELGFERCCARATPAADAAE